MVTRVVCILVKNGTSKTSCRIMWRTCPGAWCTNCHSARARKEANN